MIWNWKPILTCTSVHTTVKCQYFHDKIQMVNNKFNINKVKHENPEEGKPQGFGTDRSSVLQSVMHRMHQYWYKNKLNLK